jgi:hypothetical protein
MANPGDSPFEMPLKAIYQNLLIVASAFWKLNQRRRKPIRQEALSSQQQSERPVIPP